MKHLFHSGKFLALDLASTIFFLVLYLLTHDIPLAVALGMALGVGQIAWQRWRRAPIDTMHWMSLLLVLGSGAATLVTHDPRFIMIKPSIIYATVGVVTLKRGWMNRYLPPVAMEIVPDVGMVFGYVWAGLMFASAALNLVLAERLGVAAWAAFMSAWGLGSKLALFAVQYAVIGPSACAGAGPPRPPPWPAPRLERGYFLGSGLPMSMRPFQSPAAFLRQTVT